MLKDFTSLFIKDHAIKNKNDNLLSQMKERFNIIDSAIKTKNNIVKKFSLWGVGISYMGFFATFLHLSFRDNPSINIIAHLAITLAATVLVGSLIMVTLVVLFAAITGILDISHERIFLFSRQFKKAHEKFVDNKQILIEMLEDPTLQYELLSYVKNLKNSLNTTKHLNHIVFLESTLNDLINNLSIKNYSYSADIVISYLNYWERMEKEIELDKQTIEDSLTSQEVKQSYLQSLNFSLDDKEIEVEMEKEYNLKSML